MLFPTFFSFPNSPFASSRLFSSGIACIGITCYHSTAVCKFLPILCTTPSILYEVYNRYSRSVRKVQIPSYQRGLQYSLHSMRLLFLLLVSNPICFIFPSFRSISLHLPPYYPCCLLTVVKKSIPVPFSSSRCSNPNCLPVCISSSLPKQRIPRNRAKFQHYEASLILLAESRKNDYHSGEHNGKPPSWVQPLSIHVSECRLTTWCFCWFRYYTVFRMMQATDKHIKQA